MAENTETTTKKDNNQPLTWQEKLTKGHALNELDDVRAEADYNVKRHLREQKERAAFDRRKQRAAEGRAQTTTEGGNE